MKGFSEELRLENFAACKTRSPLFMDKVVRLLLTTLLFMDESVKKVILFFRLRFCQCDLFQERSFV